MTRLTVEDLNQADKERFVDIFGGVYEESPWIAERAWSERPFSSTEDVRQTMTDVVRNASQKKQLDLLRAHPDLGENIEMTDESEEEQASAGLDRLSAEQYKTFQQLNTTYRDKFGFPFLMSVREESVETIQNAMEERIDRTKSEEFQTALDEVNDIARLRLEELVATDEDERT
ncbi:2-oxo-4-hydroxy-4-carboxy-5-ureidoimidazoline decarboxylase [Halostagnicola bangensis]